MSMGHDDGENGGLLVTGRIFKSKSLTEEGKFGNTHGFRQTAASTRPPVLGAMGCYWFPARDRMNGQPDTGHRDRCQDADPNLRF